MRLTEYKSNAILFDGIRFRINPAFDTVLAVQKLYREEIEDWMKLDQALKMFVVNGRKLRKLTWKQKSELLEQIYREFVTDDHPDPPDSSSEPVLDFDLDSDYIFASFYLDYGIDLLKEQGHLSWDRFLALFRGLSEQTKMREVMRIRRMEIPSYNGKNQKQIQDLTRLKSYYALPIKNNSGKQGLDALFDTLEKVAKS